MRTFRYAALILLISAMVIMGVGTVSAQGPLPCETTTGDDDVICSTDVVTFNGDSGDDILVVADGTTISGDFKGCTEDDDMTNNGTVEGVMSGGPGDDVVTNNGLIEGVLRGGHDDDIVINNGTISGGSDPDMEGNHGNDTLINNGFVEEDMQGNPGDDTLINNSIVGEDMDGSAGNDTLINNGSVGEDMGGQRGNDTLINNGSVGGDIEGYGGSDTIIVNGSVGGNVYADHDDGIGRGDDTVILETGASVAGVIDGGEPDCEPDDDWDTLVFNMEVGAEYIEETARQIAEANPNGGSLTINGHVYTWTSFEELVGLLQMAMFHDARLNAFDFWATAVVYCADDISGVSMYTVDGEFVGTATLEEIYATPIGGTVTSGLGISLNWLGDDNALLVGPDGYTYVFDPAVCTVN